MAGIYIHIPFCKKACNYCNFYFVTNTTRKKDLLSALITEIELSKDYAAGEPIKTIYIGGGTPSLLNVNELSLLLNAINKNHKLSLEEFTIECNPDDLSLEQLNAYKGLQHLGLNRLSIGVQSFFDDDLKFMNRAHNSSEAVNSIKAAQDSGFDTLTIDLIYGTPGLSDERWLQNLNQAHNLKIDHLSCYALTVEPKTKLFKQIKEQKLEQPSSDKASAQFDLLMQFARNNDFLHYEISNFAKNNKLAVHNTNYWKGEKYIGIGPAAHSYNGQSRRWNISNINSYISGIEQNIIPAEEETLGSNEIFNEYIMTSLRTILGCELDKLTETNKLLLLEQLNTIDKNWYSLSNNKLTLTDKGKHFADYIASELFMI